MSAHTTVTPGDRTNGTQAVPPRTTTSLRLPALAGAVFFALMFVYAQLRSPAPAATDPAREVASYFARHHDRLQLGAVALGLAMPAALIWLSGLVQALRQVEGPSRIASLTALGGGILPRRAPSRERSSRGRPPSASLISAQAAPARVGPWFC